MASLRCEAYGFVSEIVWLKNSVQLVNGTPHTITISAGSSSAQNGGESPVASMVSIVTIDQTVEEDAGLYTCCMDGTAIQETVVLIVLTGKLASTILLSNSSLIE